MMSRALAALVLLLLAGCSEPQLRQACEDVEPWRPLIRGAIDVATEGATVVPFAITSQVHCADVEAVADQMRDRR
jgi:hypothetical protein